MKRILPPVLTVFTFFLVGVAVDMSYKGAIQRYQIRQLMQREVRLRAELGWMRTAVEKFEKDNGVLPWSLRDLVESGYLDNIPVDPITTRKDWDVNVDVSGFFGIVTLFEIHSASPGLSSEGSRYSEW